jgi:hypothetical protein
MAEKKEGKARPQMNTETGRMAQLAFSISHHSEIRIVGQRHTS